MAKKMDAQNPTTVRLSEKAQVVKDDLASIFGLKNILSAGLILLGRLSAEQKQVIIAEANNKDSKPKIKCSDIDMSECIEMVKHHVKYKIPSAEEKRLIEGLRQALGPEPKKERKRKRG